jgi:hypothetical protein
MKTKRKLKENLHQSGIAESTKSIFLFLSAEISLLKQGTNST